YPLDGAVHVGDFRTNDPNCVTAKLRPTIPPLFPPSPIKPISASKREGRDTAPSRQRSQIFLGQRRAAAPNGSRAAASSSSAKARAEVRTAVSFAVADPWSWMAIGNSMWSASAFPLRCRGPDDSTALRLYSIRCLPSSFSFEHIDPEA